MSKIRLYKKRIYRVVEITCKTFEICSNQLHDKKTKFFKSILSGEEFAFLDLADEPSPMLLCFRHGREDQSFWLVSSDKDGRGTEMADWLTDVKARFRGSGFGFEIRFPENLEKFKVRMRAFKKIL